MSADQAERQDSEILALSSIYDETVFSIEKHPQTHQYSGCYSCYFKLESPSLLSVKSGEETVSTTVTYLSPVYLYFTLPSGYPSEDQLNFTLSCCWLQPANLILVRDKLSSILKENNGSEILFDLFTFLKNELFLIIGVPSKIDLDLVAKESERFLRRVSLNSELSACLDVSLLDAVGRLKICEKFDVEREQIDMLTTPYECGICLLDRIGKNAIIIKPCHHWFCKSCLGEYFKSRIESGTVKDIGCPADGCETIVTTSLIRSIIDEKLYQRYDSLLLQVGLDTIGDILYCPLPHCQYPVIFEEGSTGVTCPSCNHSFCVFCKRTFHGVSPCRFEDEQIKKIREAYFSANKQEKLALEKRWGKGAIKRATDDFESLAFLKDNCKSCPNCNAWCEKIEGCNKMTCLKCRFYFCWLCNQELNRFDPYAHFSDPKTGCKGRLFEGVEHLIHQDPFDDWEDWERGGLFD